LESQPNLKIKQAEVAELILESTQQSAGRGFARRTTVLPTTDVPTIDDRRPTTIFHAASSASSSATAALLAPGQ